MSERTRKDNALKVMDYRLQYGPLTTAAGHRTRESVLQIVIRGRGWVIGATPVVLTVGDESVLIHAGSRDGTQLLGVLQRVPAEGAGIVLSHGNRVAKAPRPFSRKELPRGLRVTEDGLVHATSGRPAPPRRGPKGGSQRPKRRTK